MFLIFECAHIKKIKEIKEIKEIKVRRETLPFIKSKDHLFLSAIKSRHDNKMSSCHD